MRQCIGMSLDGNPPLQLSEHVDFLFEPTPAAIRACRLSFRLALISTGRVVNKEYLR
jgi:hypothetical protein